MAQFRFELILFCLIITLTAASRAQDVPGASAFSTPQDSLSSIGTRLQDVIPQAKVPIVDFKEVAIADALAALCRPHGLNIWVSPELAEKITVYLADVTLADAIAFIVGEYCLRWNYEDGILKFYPPAEADRFPFELRFDGKLLSLDFNAVPLSLAVGSLIDSTGQNIILAQGITGTLTGKLKNILLEQGLEALFSSNGFSLTKQGEILYVDRLAENSGMRRSATYEVGCDSGLITLDVRNADLQRLIEDIVHKCDLPTVLYGTLSGTVTVKCIGLERNDIFTLILRGTEYTFKEEGGVHQFGSVKMEEMRTSKFVALQHLVADDLLKIVPTSISSKLAISVLPGQNGLLATGSYGIIYELEQFIRSVDSPPAQILIEALVVDFSTNYLREFSLIANNTGKSQAGATNEAYYPEIQLYTAGKEADAKLQDLALRLGVTNIGHLSDDFYIRLRALSQEGKANVRSRPTIAALNGHEAAISIGTTQYYLLKTETVYNGGNANYTSQVSQRFETIKADVSLKVTPWVTATGEIIVDIAPEFNTPQGQFDPEIPPTINHRTLHSRVRLRDGETIVLGGMIQSLESVQIDKFPILGELPILGRLFQNRRRSATDAELMIFLTPKIYYGSEGAVDISGYNKR